MTVAMADVALNGDLRRRAVMHASVMDWQPSPSGTVFRKRYHLVGAPEGGQVTSLVRYRRESSFPAHDHPEGEEILVLNGVFSDEHGDYPAGSYLLNPEGFRHAPFSKPGCLLFVKLRQYPGQERPHLALNVGALPWEACSGGARRILFRDPRFPDEMRLERWAPGARATVTYPAGAEILVIAGSFRDAAGHYARYSWLRLPAGASHRPLSRAGCVVYMKLGGLALLRPAG